MKTLNFSFFLSLIILQIGMGQPSQEESQYWDDLSSNYLPTLLPDDTSQLWLAEGNLVSDTVVIINEGGPKVHLDFEYNGKCSWTRIPGMMNYYRVYLHQSNTYNKGMFDFKKEFTVEMAQKEVDNHAEMLYRAFRYFKDRGKTVIVIGHSYGAFIIPYCMATKPLKADKYLISGGRIDDHLERSSYFLRGYNSLLEEDGITFNPPDTTRRNPYRGERYFRIYRVKQLLKGTLGQPRYSQELANIDLSNVIYFYATKDRNVGRLTESEIEFLHQKNVSLHPTYEGHYELPRKIVEAFEKGEVSFKE